MVEEALVPYGEAVGKTLWNYFKISEYLKVEASKLRHGETHYDSVAELWADALKNSLNLDGKPKLQDGRVVRLIDFSLTEWFPWSPGMYWTPYGTSLRYGALHYHEKNKAVLDRLNEFVYRDNRSHLVLSPYGKTLTVLSGVGAIRTKFHMINGQQMKIIGATTPELVDGTGHRNWPNVSGGVPIMMSKKAYDKVKSRIEQDGAVKATIEGFYTEIPNVLDDMLWRAPNMPRFCIYVGSDANIHDIKQGTEVLTAGLSIFEDKKHEYKMAFCSFSALEEKGAEVAGAFLEEYIHGHEGVPLTDFDEKVPRLDATFPITAIANGEIDRAKLRVLASKIRRKYR